MRKPGHILDRYLIAVSAVILGVAMLSMGLSEGAPALLVVLVLSVAAIAAFRSFGEDSEFLTTIFLTALAARLLFGLAVHIFDLRDFFGGDALTYDYNGWLISQDWLGNPPEDSLRLRRATTTSLPGWGMNYFVGAVYLILGRNILAAQSACAVFGAATAPLVYFCAAKIFSNRRVATFSAIAIALFPTFILWSSQLVKDGLIIFLLVLAMTMVLTLQTKFNYGALVLLVFSLFGIMSLRFYIFYMVAVAVAGSFLIGLTNTSGSLVRRTAALLILGIALTYLGVLRNAGTALEDYGDLERLQMSRLDQARSAESGFNEDVDVSTTEGALSAIPVGFAYLMFAPFPWQAGNLRQAITIPEVLVWWGMMPFMAAGVWFSIRSRLRSAFPILLFSLMLTIAYSIFQGNVGTAYRQRAQIQVFLFIFVAVGWTLYRERQEDKELLRRTSQRRFDSRVPTA